ncbi:hypothetical protein ASC75_05080 [Aminobacter sp. DSM 101952]|uniref:hypothetical protein n=1 Tax=Aminobacter sp. DSM 101952 TaxID=2735891 RepID=UPI000700C76B|nr:hypothetical protein [Aminobacter sp. DSM 101952]KQU73035.1 hypothetical protein ASC75_05080 [Aminobacter sp. DSM 101952]
MTNLTLETLPTATKLADHRAAIEFALKLDAPFTSDFLEDWLNGADLEARWLAGLREDLAYGTHEAQL